MVGVCGRGGVAIFAFIYDLAHQSTHINCVGAANCEKVETGRKKYYRNLNLMRIL